MNPNTPDQIWLGSKEYTWRTDWTVNGWLMIAALLSGASDIMFPGIVKEWPVAVQSLVAVLPFLALLLWARGLTQWIKGMDELHRRITASAVLFAVSATFFVIMLWHRLDVAGLFDAIFPAASGTRGSWDIGTIGHAALLLTLFYMAGHPRFSRRYQ